MRLYKTNRGIVAEDDGRYYLLPQRDWDDCINRKNLHQKLKEELGNLPVDETAKSETEKNLLAPVGTQEVWAAGVTYLRSREARMEEAKDAGGGDFYAKVYEAERPELFFKSPAQKVIGPAGNVRIRKDSHWNVPEPELMLFISSHGTIEGYTIGNDMSSRDIEGENPLYLPQAKMYDGAAAVGPCLYIPENGIDKDANIHLQILRNQNTVFDGTVSINRMKRKHEELVHYLFLETSFPRGVFLMTGTGLVPPDDFTLQIGDQINIAIDGIGVLTNTVSS